MKKCKKIALYFGLRNCESPGLITAHFWPMPSYANQQRLALFPIHLTDWLTRHIYLLISILQLDRLSRIGNWNIDENRLVEI